MLHKVNEVKATIRFQMKKVRRNLFELSTLPVSRCLIIEREGVEFKEIVLTDL